MIFHVLSIDPSKHLFKKVTVPSTLYVFNTGDFVVLPSNQKIDINSQVFASERNKLRFNFKRSSLIQIPFIKYFCFFPTLFAWLLRKKWRLSVQRASALRELLVDNGFNLIYVKDDVYRISFFRFRKLRLKFFRRLPSMTFVPADVPNLNHTVFTGLKIYFNVKK